MFAFLADIIPPKITVREYRSLQNQVQEEEEPQEVEEQEVIDLEDEN